MDFRKKLFSLVIAAIASLYAVEKITQRGAYAESRSTSAKSYVHHPDSILNSIERDLNNWKNQVYTNQKLDPSQVKKDIDRAFVLLLDARQHGDSEKIFKVHELHMKLQEIMNAAQEPRTWN